METHSKVFGIFYQKMIWIGVKKNVRIIKVNPSSEILMLFDSRYLHQTYSKQNNRKCSKFRYVVYIAMTLAKRAKTKDLKKKLKTIKEGRTTSH